MFNGISYLSKDGMHHSTKWLGIKYAFLSSYHFFQSLPGVTRQLACVRSGQESPRSHRHSRRHGRRCRQRRLQPRRRGHGSSVSQVKMNTIFCGLPGCRLWPSTGKWILIVVCSVAAWRLTGVVQVLAQHPKLDFCCFQFGGFLVHLTSNIVGIIALFQCSFELPWENLNFYGILCPICPMENLV